jgi:ABC-type sugar transport system permease subunit
MVSTRERRRRLTGLFFVLPAFLFVLLFMVFPLLYSAYLSTTRYNFVYDASPSFIGLRNFVEIFRDPLFLNSIRVSLVFVVLVLPIGVLVPLILALLLDSAGSLGARTSAYESAIFVPLVVPVSLACIIFLLLLDPSTGYINFLLTRRLALPKFNWVGNGWTALLIMVLISNWEMGYQVLLFFTALKGVDRELLEAAQIDGASTGQRILHVTLPQIRGTTAVVTVLAIIRAFKIFVQPMVMTRGGPLHATETIYFYLYRTGFEFFEMGKASAMAYFLSFAILLVSIANLKIFRTD